MKSQRLHYEVTFGRLTAKALIFMNHTRWFLHMLSSESSLISTPVLFNGWCDVDTNRAADVEASLHSIQEQECHPGNTLDGSVQGHDNVNKNVTQAIP